MRAFKISFINHFQAHSPVFLATVRTPYVRDFPRTYFPTGGLTDSVGDSEPVPGTQCIVTQQQRGKLCGSESCFQHYAKWKPWDTDVYTLYDRICMSFPGKTSTR